MDWPSLVPGRLGYKPRSLGGRWHRSWSMRQRRRGEWCFFRKTVAGEGWYIVRAKVADEVEESSQARLGALSVFLCIYVHFTDRFRVDRSTSMPSSNFQIFAFEVLAWKRDSQFEPRAIAVYVYAPIHGAYTDYLEVLDEFVREGGYETGGAGAQMFVGMLHCTSLMIIDNSWSTITQYHCA